MDNFRAFSIAITSISLWVSSCNAVNSTDHIASKAQTTQLEVNKHILTESKPSSKLTSADKLFVQEDAATDIAFIQTSYEFGNIAEGDIVEHMFAFTNTGDSPLIILDAETTCGCTIPVKPENPVLPGETGEIQVRFNSHGRFGIVRKAVNISANTSPAITQLFIKANVTPRKEVTTESE